MKIIFMGTPSFALKTLEALNRKYNVELIVTRSDKPVGRKKEIIFSPVKKFAVDNNLKFLQPEKLKNNNKFTEALKMVNPDIICVAAYGKILTKEILDLPKYGCINLHASLLPKYRGAAPINWAIINGEKETGVTIMKMDSGMDTGNIISRHKIKIQNNDDALSLDKKLSELGAKKIIEFVDNVILHKSYKHRKQNDLKSILAPKINKKDALINWQEDANTIRNLIRGYNPWPIAFTNLGNQTIKIFKAEIDNSLTLSSGKIENRDGRLIVGCGKGNLEITQIQKSGQKKISGKEFLNGIYNLENPFFT